MSPTTLAATNTNSNPGSLWPWLKSFLLVGEPRWRFNAVCGYLCILSFATGVMLMGVTKLSGVFYMLAMVLGIPILLLQVDWSRMRVGRNVLIFAACFLGMIGLYAGHLFLGNGKLSNFDTIIRVGAGLLNGLFFFAVFRYRRAPLFGFVILLALLNTALLSAFALFDGLSGNALESIRGRVGGSGNAIAYSELLATSFGICVIYFAGRIGRNLEWRRLLVLAAFFLVGVFAVLMTGTRGTLFALPPLLVLAALALRIRHAVPLSIAAFVLVAGFAMVVSPNIQKRSLETVTDITGLVGNEDGGSAMSLSSRMRFRLWTASIELSGDNLLLGRGQGMFQESLRQMDPPPPEAEKLYVFNQAHNQFLNFLVETGLVGLILFLGMLIVPMAAGVYTLRRTPHRERGLILIWVPVSYGIYGLTQAFFSHGVTSLQFGIYAGMLLWAAPDPKMLAIWPRQGSRSAVAGHRSSL